MRQKEQGNYGEKYASILKRFRIAGYRYEENEMMKSETDFSHHLQPELRKAKCFVQAIESGLTGTGIPDLFIKTKRNPLWMELKHLYYPLGDAFDVPYRPGQYPWLTRYCEKGGISVLGISYNGGFMFFANDHIGERYTKPFFEEGDLFLEKINGKIIAQWLDNLRPVY
jgi:hypothetical protein